MRLIIPVILFIFATADSLAEESLLEFARRLEGRSAHALLVGDTKLGWSTTERSVEDVEGIPTVRLIEALLMGGATEDGDEEFREESWKRYRLDGDGELIEAWSGSTEDGATLTRTAHRKGDQLVIVSESHDHRRERSIAAPADTFGQYRRLVDWLASEPAPNSRFEMTWLLLDDDDCVEPRAFDYRRRTSVTRDGDELVAHDVAAEEDGLDIDALLRWDGVPFVAEFGGFELRLEEESAAKSIEDTADITDLTDLVGVAVERRLGHPSEIAFSRLLVRGIGDFALPRSERQVVAVTEDGEAIVDLRAVLPSGAGAALDEPAREKYLRSTDVLQCDHEDIREAAAEATAVADDEPAFAKAGAILLWISWTLEPSYARNASTALDVLANGAGDCTEHTALFVALARASGIPAREVGGLVYGGDDPPRFAWHAWAEIHDGRHWIAMDPTFGEEIPDATHLTLSTDEDNAWLNVMGRIEIEVLDYRRDDS